MIYNNYKKDLINLLLIKKVNKMNKMKLNILNNKYKIHNNP
jgi:hypothetical protein